MNKTAIIFYMIVSRFDNIKLVKSLKLAALSLELRLTP